MARDLHTVAVSKASSPLSDQGKLKMTLIKGFASAAGGSAGASVATAITGLEIPTNAAVFVTASQDAVPYISGRFATGLTVNLSPRLAANTLAAGTFDLLILA